MVAQSIWNSIGLTRRLTTPLVAAAVALSLVAGCGDDGDATNNMTNNGADTGNNDAGNDCSTYEELSEDVDAEVTLDGCYDVTSSITVGADGHLTIMPGSVLRFAEDTGLNVGGRLTAEGTADSGILFHGLESTPGYWRGIRFGDTTSSDNKLVYVTIDGAGSENSFGDVEPSNLGLGYWNGETSITLQNSTIRNSAAWGVYARDNTNFTAFENNTITGNANGAMMAGPHVIGDLDVASDYTGNTEDIIEIPGGDLTEAATWKGVNVPYFVSDNLKVTGDGADLVVEPGATFQFDEQVGLEVVSDATLNAVGTADAPITFEGSEATAGWWRGIRFANTTGSSNELTHVVIDGGGSDNAFDDVEASNLGMGYWNGETKLTLKNSTIRNSGAWGVYARDNTNFTAFENNTITSNTNGAMMAGPHVIGDLDAASDYSANTEDIIEIPGGDLTEAATWKGVNVPYFVSDNLKVTGDGADLVVEPGATFQFDERVGLEVVSDATLNAVGTTDNKITFEGSDSSAGWWRGIRFANTTSSSNELTYVVVDGGGSDNAFDDVEPSNVGLGYWNGPTSIKLTNTELTNSGGSALYLRDNASLTECSGLNISAGDISGDGAADAVATCGL